MLFVLVLNNLILETILKDFLDQKYLQYAQSVFIHDDPIRIPHQFQRKEDIEIAGFLTAIISWGRRPAIISKAQHLMNLMDNSPFEFVTEAISTDLIRLEKFVYRTFNSSDLLFLVGGLKEIYVHHGGLEEIANQAWTTNKNVKMVIVALRQALLAHPHLARSEKHLANPLSGSAAKRINMFLRWMVRPKTEGVDFGLWKNIPTSALQCPLDVHVSRVGLKLGILQRKQNDWKAVEELTQNLTKLDSNDPVKYDFALFGLGVYEKF